MDLTFKEIYIFNLKEEKAFFLAFKEGINIITSNEYDGTDRGKSVLLKSLYFSLGADVFFDKSWDIKNTVTLLKFEYDKKEYFIYRNEKQFKIFNNNKLLFSCTKRYELSKFFETFFNFGIYLKDKDQGIKLANIVYSFLLNFVDQDKYNGTKFESFEHLNQFADYKIDTIFHHLNVYDKTYYIIIDNIEKLLSKKKKIEIENDVFEKIKNEALKNASNIYSPETLENLKIELTIEENKYFSLIKESNDLRIELIKLRTDYLIYKDKLNSIENIEKKERKKTKNIFRFNKCIECNSAIEENITKLKSKKLNFIENLIYIKSQIKTDIEITKSKINEKETLYSKKIKDIQEYKNKLKVNQNNVNNIFKQISMNYLCDDINKKIKENSKIIFDLLQEMEKENEKINQYKKQIKIINSDYYNLMNTFVQKFEINEIKEENYKTLKKSGNAGGSNKPFFTVIWYIVLNILKKKYNKLGINFPMVFDSPTNAEMDTKKKQELINFIFEYSSIFNQLIVSTINFSNIQINKEKNVNIIELNNEKFKLLNSNTYNEKIDILKFFIDL
ncbi:MAG: hypothetical protein ACTTJO_02160 [Metamycoplasmataceae bacterium]